MRACARVREWLQGVHFMCIAHTHAHALTRRMRSMHTCIRLHAHVSAGNARMTAHACAGRRACVFHAYMHGRVSARQRACVSVCATRADARCAAPAAPTHLLSWSPPTGTLGSGTPSAYDMCCICVRLRVSARWRARRRVHVPRCRSPAGEAHEPCAPASCAAPCAAARQARAREGGAAAPRANIHRRSTGDPARTHMPAATMQLRLHHVLCPLGRRACVVHLAAASSPRCSCEHPPAAFGGHANRSSRGSARRGGPASPASECQCS